MPITPISDLLSWVVTRWKPQVAQVKAWMNSYWHKDELIPANKIDGLNLNNYVTINQLNNIAGALIPIEGLANGPELINFSQRTTVFVIEFLSNYDGTAQVGIGANNSEYGEVEYVAGSVATIIINRGFQTNEGLYITTTNAANYLIRKA